MGIGGTFTAIAERFIEPVERTGDPGEFTALMDAVERQARQIRDLHAQLDLIERQTGRSPPRAW